MRRVELFYNPFLVETRILIDEVPSDGEWSAHKGDRLQLWIDKLFSYLVNECNDDFSFCFHGTEVDYNDVLEALHDFMRMRRDISVKILEPSLNSGADARMEKLKELFEYIQQTCPFDDLKTEEVRANFRKALGTEFEVSVIATMSSGKSTLINAMLGKQLMPAKNEACTATIAEIKDDDDMEGFVAQCYDVAGNPVPNRSSESLTPDEMNEYNSDENVSTIKIKGNIPFVCSKNTQLVLLDTPGPNNSRNEEHRVRTHHLIDAKTMPMVLYVLNGTQLSTNDDKILLDLVAKAMKVGGKQSKDRFIFAVNKVDTFDLEAGDSIDSMLANLRNYLLDCGIENPNIYPVSAEFAKIIRMDQNGEPLSRQMKRKLCEADMMTEEPAFHLERYAPLSKSVREKFAALLQKAQDEGDAQEENLLHTGVPSVELAINEYLEKYALTNKVKTAVDTFQKKIESHNLMQSLVEQLQKNQDRCEALKQQINIIRSQVRDGRKAELFRQKIKQLDMTGQANSKMREIRTEIFAVLNDPGTNLFTSKMTKVQIGTLMYKLNQEISNLQVKFKTDMDTLLETDIRDNAQKITEEYRDYVEDLFQGTDFSVGDFSAADSKMLLDTYLPDADEIMEKYQYEQKEKVGEHWVENTNKAWYKPWTWFDDAGWTEEDFEVRQYIDGEKVFNDYIVPVKQRFNDNIEAGRQQAKQEAEAFKRFFLGELDKLNKVLEDKLQEMEALADSAKNIQANIDKMQARKEWLSDFQNRMMLILDIH